MIQTVTNYNWCVGGQSSSSDNYATHTLSVFRHWYVYRHKPSWFNRANGDRYIGKLRWISQKCDGKQWKNITQRAQYDGKVFTNQEDKRTFCLMQGYLRPYHYGGWHWHGTRQGSKLECRLSYRKGLGQCETCTRKSLHCVKCGKRQDNVRHEALMRSWDQERFTIPTQELKDNIYKNSTCC